MLSRVLLRFAIFLQVFTLRDERYVPSALRPIVGPVVHFRHVLCHTCWTCVLGARFPHAATVTVVIMGVFLMVLSDFCVELGTGQHNTLL